MRGEGELRRSLRESPLWGATREQMDEWARAELRRLDPRCIEHGTTRRPKRPRRWLRWVRS